MERTTNKYLKSKQTLTTPLSMKTLKMIGLIFGIILLGFAGLVAIIAVMSIPLWGAIYLIGEIIKAVV